VDGRGSASRCPCLYTSSGPCDAYALYTDIWVSMGREGEEARRVAELGPYWINDSLVKLVKPDALVMHCLPTHRGQEIDEKTFEAHAQTFFEQAETDCMFRKRFSRNLVKIE
jgi:ornithine carbamoyltransferase